MIFTVGKSRLKGDVRISGSKNAALAILPATLLCKDECIIHNVPDIADIRIMLQLIENTGARCYLEGHTAIINARDVDNPNLPDELVGSIRASIYMLGVLVSRLGAVEMKRPGGCDLNRRVNFHVDALRAMGATVHVNGGEEHLCAHRQNHLHGIQIELDPRWRSVGTTVNVMLSATLARGITVIHNAAREPEVVNCAQFLKAMGAQINGEGTSTITIMGVSELHGCEFSIINDRIEAGTFLIAAALTRGDVRVGPIQPEWLQAVLEKLEQTGTTVMVQSDVLRVRSDRRVHAVSLTTAPYPDFPTDLQPPFVTLLSVAKGRSAVTETIHEGRLRYCDELRKMGAMIEIEEPKTMCDDEVRLPAVAYIDGVEKLHGAVVKACDLRAGAALILAGLVADGETVVHGIDVVERGYECFFEKIQSLGGMVKWLAVEDEPYARQDGCLTRND